METDLEMARRHVVETENRIVRQEALLDRMRRLGYDTALGERLLATYRDFLQLAREHVSYEQKKLHQP